MAPSKEVPEFPVDSAPCSCPHPAFDALHLSSIGVKLNPSVALCDFTTLPMVNWISPPSVPGGHGTIMLMSSG